MKAPLLHLVFDVAATLFAHIAQHLAQHVFQAVVTHSPARRSIRILNRFVAVVTDVEGGTIQMARVLGSIAVMSAQLGHIGLGTQHAGNNGAMQGNALYIQAVEECLSYILQQHRRTGHQVRNTRVQLVDMHVRVGTHIHQLAFTLLGILAVLYTLHAPLHRCSQLHRLGIGKTGLKAGHRVYLVLLGGRRKLLTPYSFLLTRITLSNSWFSQLRKLGTYHRKHRYNAHKSY